MMRQESERDDSQMGRLAGRRILVTGAKGFIGSHLCQRLNELGAEVHGVSRRQLPLSIRGVQWWRADLAAPETARRVVDTVAPDAVVHLCSHAEGIQSPELVWPTLESELMTTVNMLLAVIEVGCSRFIMTGSLEEPEPGTVASSPYAAAKSASTAYARMSYRLYGVPLVILRLFMVYGPGQPAHKVVPQVMRCFLQNEAPKVKSGGRRIDWIYIADVVEAFTAALVAPGIEGRTLDIGTGKAVCLRELVNLAGQLTGTQLAAEFSPASDRRFERECVADPLPAQELLGWVPRTSLKDGLAATLEWLRAQRQGECEARNPKFELRNKFE